MVNRVGKNIYNNIAKNIYNNIEIYNYLNMKQNIEVTFCTQQELDSFSAIPCSSERDICQNCNLKWALKEPLTR